METIPTIEKHDLKNRLKKLLIATRPQDLVHMTNENIKFVMHYINGYVDCLNKFSEQPLNDSEVESLIDNEILEKFNELIT